MFRLILFFCFLSSSTALSNREMCYGLLSRISGKADLQWRLEKWNHSHTEKKFTEPSRIILEHGGVPYSVYANAYMTITLNTACNAKCCFCIQEVVQKKHDGTYSKPSTKGDLSPAVYAQVVESALKFIRPVNPSISISGGEPTLSSRLPVALEKIRSSPPPLLVLHTNGTRLLDKAPGQNLMTNPPKSSWTVLDHLLEANLNHLNLSIAHHDPELNASIMRMTINDARKLSEAIQTAVSHGVRPRFSLVLLKEGVHDIRGLKEYLDWAISLGVDDVWIRELSEYDPATTFRDSTTEYIDRERVKIGGLLHEIDNDSNFQLALQKSTVNSYRESYRYRNELDVGITAYRITPPVVHLSGLPGANNAEPIKVFVLHPNGSLNAAWQEWERVIIPAPSQQ